MSQPSFRHPDKNPPTEPAPALPAKENADTLPLNTTTKRDESLNSEATTPTIDPLLAATQIDVDVSGLAPTMGGPTAIDQTLEFVQREVKRKATAILHTKVGDYEIERELGRGGMGVVYKAHHRQLHRDVALKMILAGKHAGPDQLERFLIEAQSVAQLQHPNIVQIFDISEQDGLPYFSLEFVDGKSLAQVINKQPQDPKEAARTIEVLSRTMQYAHDHGVLHRDLKPANVLLTKEGLPKISDFGLAKKVDDHETASTQTGTVMGTPSYMSPEQASGLTHDVGPAADQYSLGAMLYELLTGRPPFLAAKPVETILQVIHDEPVRPKQLQPSTPVDIETICLKALQKDASKRYPNCAELADDLSRFLNGEPIIARPVGNLERAWRWCRRNPTIAVPSGLAVLFLCTAVVVLAWSSITVSRQNVVIKKERDFAQEKEREAKANEELAKERAEAAKKQAQLVLTTLQTIMTEVDTKVSQLPGVTETRMSILDSIVKAWDQIDASVRDDEEGSAVPTLMVVRQKIASVYLSLGKLNLADEEYRKLYDMGKHRITVKKGTDGARYNMAVLCNGLGDVRQQVHRDMTRSKQYYEEALGIIRDVLENPRPDPKQGPIRMYAVKAMHAGILQNLGVIHLRTGQLDHASRYFDEARVQREQVLQTLHDDPAFIAESEFGRQNITSELNIALDKSYLAQGEVLSRLGNTELAEKLNLAAVKRRKEIYERESKNTLNAQEYARFCGHAGEFYLLRGRPKEGRPFLEQAVTMLANVVKDNPESAILKDYLTHNRYRLGCLLDELGEQSAALDQFQLCRQLREEISQGAKESSKRQSQLMMTCARCGDTAKAVQLAESLTASAKPDSELLLERARAMAQCSKNAATEEQRMDLLNKAFGYLQSAVDGGYSDPSKIQVEPDLKPLRDNPRFAEILSQAALGSQAEVSKK